MAWACSGPTAGTVTFRDGATTLGTRPLVNGFATLTTSALGLGVHTVTASYSGDGANFAASDTGTISTVAGGGSPKNNGENVPATSAPLIALHSVAVGPDGAVWAITDETNGKLVRLAKAD